MPLLQGILLGAGICISLGPQSVFVLRQGIRGEAAFAVAVVCTAADVLLISAAIAGADAFILLIPKAANVAGWGTAAFALAYGYLALSAALRRRPDVNITRDDGAPRAWVLPVALALSFLNPQVYFEMVVLVGGIALQFPQPDRMLFGLGVALVSPLWFFGLAFGGRRFAGVFVRPMALSAFDIGSGLVMLVLAIMIIESKLS
jgi:L-lysine exporter family protein LysE/ArgO